MIFYLIFATANKTLKLRVRPSREVCSGRISLKRIVGTSAVWQLQKF